MADLARAGIQQTATGTPPNRQCVAALVHVYDHGVRELAKRLTQAYHDHQDMAVATLHVHLDHDSCMEVTVLKGQVAAARSFSEQVIAERGVKHGRLVMVPVQISVERHAHGFEGTCPHGHAHVR